MIAIVVVMLYSIYESWQNPPPSPLVKPTESPVMDVFSKLSPSPSVGVVLSPSPSPSLSPSPTPTEKPKPKPSPSPTKKVIKKKIEFAGEPIDGPPKKVKKAKEGIFEGKERKLYITVYSRSFEGAKVYLIDNISKKYWEIKFRKVGENQYQAQAPPSDYTLKIVKKGYFTFKERLPLTEDGLGADIRDPLEKMPYLDIRSKPKGAEIYINGKYAGITPKVIKYFYDKTYTIKLTKAGFMPKQFKIKFKRGKGITKTIKLKRR